MAAKILKEPPLCSKKPPVVSTPFEKEYFRTTYATAYFFSAQAMRTVNIKMIELIHVYRQEERSFINLLDNIRLNNMDYEDFMYLNERHQPLPEDKAFYITLSSRNDIANNINEAELKAIALPAISFQATVVGEFNPQLFPTEFNLILKKGAQVMFVKNDLQKQFVNGSIGIIEELSEDRILVKILDDRER